MRWLRKLFPLTLAVLLILMFSEPLIPEATAQSEGSISFQPNVIPELQIHFVEEFFRFQWLNNRFDLKLLISYEDKLLSLRDFSEKDKAIKWHELVSKATESMYEFGYQIADIPEIVADNVDYLLWKVEGASFDVDEIELEVIDDEDYNITRFHLPDNLVLSYEDLWLYDFTVSQLDKTTTKIENVKGKSSWNLDPITFSSPVITVNSEDVTFQDIADADTANGWEAFKACERSENRCYVSGARLVLTNSSTLTDSLCQIVFNSSCVSTHSQVLITVEIGCSLTFGTLIDAATRRTKNGVSLLFVNAGNKKFIRIIQGVAGATIYLYSSSFQQTGYSKSTYSGMFRSIPSGSRIWNCILDNVYPFSSTLDIYRTTILNAYYGMGQVAMLYSDDLLIHDNNYAFYFRGGTPQTIRNVVAKNNGVIYAYALTSDRTLINPDIDDWSFGWVSSSGSVIRQYTYDLLCTYPNGTTINGTETGARATIRHYGQAGATDYNATLGEDGTITQQTLSMGFYNQTGGDTIYSYNPYNLRLWNLTGYQDLNMNFTLTEETDWTISLAPETEGDIATGFIFGGILAILIMTVLGLAYIGKK